MLGKVANVHRPIFNDLKEGQDALLGLADLFGPVLTGQLQGVADVRRTINEVVAPVLVPDRLFI